MTKDAKKTKAKTGTNIEGDKNKAPGRFANLPRRLPSRSLARRIFAINLTVLAIPVGGFFFLGQVEQSLIQQEINGLQVQAETFAGALAVSAVITTPDRGQWLHRDRASELIRNLASPGNVRARLFSIDGELMADSRELRAPRGLVRIEELPPPGGWKPSFDFIVDWFDALIDWRPSRRDLPIYIEHQNATTDSYDEVRLALSESGAGAGSSHGFGAIRVDEQGVMVLSVAVPVQRFRQVTGVVMLSSDANEVSQGMRQVRLGILRVSVIALAATVLLSLYLAGTIGRPLSRLAAAANRVRRGQGRQVDIPDLTHRHDEIGDLSRNMHEMTNALWARMDAIERFAADVAHELKNPLTSLRSAVETIARIEDSKQRDRLLAIIIEDVARLDRLITDISAVSRLDAELSRSQAAPVDLGRVLQAVTDLANAKNGPEEAAPGAAQIVLKLPEQVDLSVEAIESRLGQVFINIVDNAQSFAPTDGTIMCRVRPRGSEILITIDDTGPGIPENKLEAIFERFYTDRPVGGKERFGVHSGLGLNIARQIVESAGGRIWAENRQGPDGKIIGTRFSVALPVADHSETTTETTEKRADSENT